VQKKLAPKIQKKLSAYGYLLFLDPKLCRSNIAEHVTKFPKLSPGEEEAWIKIPLN